LPVNDVKLLISMLANGNSRGTGTMVSPGEVVQNALCLFNAFYRLAPIISPHHSQAVCSISEPAIHVE